MLAGTHVLLGVTGSIVAYQAADLIGLLRKELASVRVVMTRSATRFITPLTLEVISAVQVNVDRLKTRGVSFVDPEYGPMVCGGEGWGRLARLEEIVRRASQIVRQVDASRADGLSRN